MLEESERRVGTDQTPTYENRDADRAIWVNYRTTVSAGTKNQWSQVRNCSDATLG